MGRDHASKNLIKILESKGYEITEDESQANQEFAIEAFGYSWSDGPETFSYASLMVANGMNSAPNICNYIRPHEFSCRKSIFYKRAAVKCMLDNIETNLPAIRK